MQSMIIRPVKWKLESKEKFRLSNSFSTHEKGYRNSNFMRVKAFLIKTGCKIRKIYRKIYILAETYRLIIDIGKVLFLFINYRSILWLITNKGVFLTQTFLWYPKINHHKVKKDIMKCVKLMFNIKLSRVDRFAFRSCILYILLLNYYSTEFQP